jgi:hypothetical protein
MLAITTILEEELKIALNMDSDTFFETYGVTKENTIPAMFTHLTPKGLEYRDLDFAIPSEEDEDSFNNSIFD